MSEPLIELDHVSRRFQVGTAQITAVDDVSLAVNAGDIVCLVGESGCGKTTTGKMAAGLLPPSSGQIRYKGKAISSLSQEEFRDYRRSVQIIHQDPYASLNPVRTIYQSLSAPLFRHKLVRTRREARHRLFELLEVVGLTPPDEVIDKYPHQLSGGQRQRVAVARALTVNPKLIVADEAVSMVDVSIRISLLNMLTRLRDEFGVTFLFITHDLALAKYFAWEGQIGVMYVGRLVELGRTPRLLSDPLHPYTQALLAAIPEADPVITRTKKRPKLRSDEIPSLLDLPMGCRFHPRCPVFEAGLCDSSQPQLVELAEEHLAACHITARDRGKEGGKSA